MMVGNIIIIDHKLLVSYHVHSDSVHFTVEPDGSVQVDIPSTTQKWAVTLKFEL